MAEALNWLSAREMMRGYAAGTVSPVDVFESALAQLHKINPALNAVCFLDEATGRRMAQQSAARWQKKAPLGPLDGVPVAVKDTNNVTGWPTRIGSLTTPTSPATQDTPGVARLRETGAVLFCKTTTPEFGWKGITHSPLSGITRNPWDPSRTPGGSSGGSAVLVATGVVPLATGGDGGGSIRIPAAFSGIYGLKPSYGLVPNQPGAVGTLGVYGGLSRDVSDTALLLSVLGQPDPRDSFAVPYQSMDYFASLDQGVSGLRIAWSPNLGFPIVDHAVADGITTAVEALRAAGAEVSTVALDLSDARDALDVIWRAAFSGMVRDMDGVQLASLDPGLLHLALSSAKLTASALQKAQDAMRALSQRMQLFHQDYDLLLAPTLPITAFEAGLDTPDPSRFPCWYDWTPFTWPFNLTRQPAASVPCGFVAGLPIGLQIIGPMFSEAFILRASRCVEQACGSDRRPPGT